MVPVTEAVAVHLMETALRAVHLIARDTTSSLLALAAAVHVRAQPLKIVELTLAATMHV